MARADSCSLLFDGLLFDAEQLRRSLGELPTEPTDDAELVLQAYLQRRGELLQDLRGLFSLVIGDRRTGRILCARDPMGHQPLFYALDGTQLLLSTSPETLARDPRVPGALNRAVLADHLCGRWPDPHETYFASVRRIPPGHLLEATENAVEVKRFWGLMPSEATSVLLSEEEVEQFDGLFEQAVARALQVGPSGILLSGGFDSISIAAVAIDLFARRDLAKPWALSLAFRGDDSNEEEIQAQVAASLGIPQVMLPFDEAAGQAGLFWGALSMSAELPAPLFNSWGPAYTRLQSEGREHGCRAILTGAGGDDWLTVSPRYLADLLRGFRLVEGLSLTRAMLRSYSAPRTRLLRYLLWKSGARPILSAYAQAALRTASPALLESRRRTKLVDAIPVWVAPEPDLRAELEDRVEQRVAEMGARRVPPRPYGFSMGEGTGFFQTTVARQKEEDFEVGRRSGLRLVHPYWDPDLASFLYRVPPRIALKGGREKGLIRDAVARRFPALRLQRRKKVVATEFFHSIVKREGPPAWRRLGGPQALAACGVVDGRLVESVLTEGLASENPAVGNRIWAVLMLEAWVRARL